MYSSHLHSPISLVVKTQAGSLTSLKDTYWGWRFWGWWLKPPGVPAFLPIGFRHALPFASWLCPASSLLFLLISPSPACLPAATTPLLHTGLHLLYCPAPRRTEPYCCHRHSCHQRAPEPLLLRCCFFKSWLTQWLGSAQLCAAPAPCRGTGFVSFL